MTALTSTFPAIDCAQFAHKKQQPHLNITDEVAYSLYAMILADPHTSEVRVMTCNDELTDKLWSMMQFPNQYRVSVRCHRQRKVYNIIATHTTKVDDGEALIFEEYVDHLKSLAQRWQELIFGTSAPSNTSGPTNGKTGSHPLEFAYVVRALNTCGWTDIKSPGSVGDPQYRKNLGWYRDDEAQRLHTLFVCMDLSVKDVTVFPRNREQPGCYEELIEQVDAQLLALADEEGFTYRGEVAVEFIDLLLASAKSAVPTKKLRQTIVHRNGHQKSEESTQKRLGRPPGSGKPQDDGLVQKLRDEIAELQKKIGELESQPKKSVQRQILDLREELRELNERYRRADFEHQGRRDELVTAQKKVEQLSRENDQLRHQVEEGKKSASPAGRAEGLEGIINDLRGQLGDSADANRRLTAENERINQEVVGTRLELGGLQNKIARLQDELEKANKKIEELTTQPPPPQASAPESAKTVATILAGLPKQKLPHNLLVNRKKLVLLSPYTGHADIDGGTYLPALEKHNISHAQIREIMATAKKLGFSYAVVIEVAYRAKSRIMAVAALTQLYELCADPLAGGNAELTYQALQDLLSGGKQFKPDHLLGLKGPWISWLQEEDEKWRRANDGRRKNQ